MSERAVVDLERAPEAPAGGIELRRRLGSWDTLIVLLAVVVLIAASLAVPNFGTSRNFTFLILDLMPIMLVALPMTFIIITGEIDLSVASTLGLASAIMGYLWNQGLSIESIIPICIIAGAVLGALNGFLVTGLGLPSLAVTIGTLALYRGLALVVLGDGAVADFPFSYTGWVTGTIGDGPVPNVLILIVVLATIFGVVLHATPFGRSLYAIGANAETAHFSGIRVARTSSGCTWSAVRSPDWSGCSGRCGTPAPGPTTARGSNWPWSPRCSSAASPSSAARAPFPASWPAWSCWPPCRTRCACRTCRGRP